MSLHHHHTTLEATSSPLLRRLDPRGKLLSALLAVASISSVPYERTGWVLVFFVAVLVLVEVSGFGTGRAFLRASVVLPFVLLPVLLLPWVSEISWEEALWRAAAVGVRGFCAAVVVVLLMATTPLRDLCAGAERMGAPRQLVATVYLTERYIRLLSGKAKAMLRAARLRGFGQKTQKKRVRATGAMIGSLLVHTLDRSERVFWAMRARGYDGRVRRLSPLRFGWRDAAALFLSALWSAGLVYMTRVRP